MSINYSVHTLVYLLKRKSAPKFLLCLLKGNLLRWRTADKQKLILRLHGLDLLHNVYKAIRNHHNEVS